MLNKQLAGGRSAQRKPIDFCADIHHICEPLFSCLPIKVFEYSRIYPDGSRLMLCSSADYLHDVIVTQWQKGFYPPDFFNKGQRYVLADSWINDLAPPFKKQCIDRLDRERELFFIGNEIKLIRESEDYYEGFHFYAPYNSYGVNNIYINSLDILENFSIYFINTARDIIRRISSERAIKPWRMKQFFDTKVVINFENSLKTNIIFSMVPKRFFLDSDGFNYLTRKEIVCASLLINGKTSSETAQLLHVSKRTVETHLESLKNKTGCATRSEVINYLYCSGLVNMLLALTKHHNLS